MKQQRGQTMVEFALMLPFMVLFILGMIYGGAMFMEYLNFSNNARQIAREVSVLENVDNREDIIKSYSDDGKDGEKKFAHFYTATRKIFYTYEKKTVTVTNTDGETTETEENDTSKPVDVVVMVEFKRDNADLPNILKWVGFPPEEINPIVYRMRLEKKPSQETSSDS